MANIKRSTVQKEKDNMKTIQNLSRLLSIASIVATVSLFGAIPSAQAQEKGATRLLQLQTTQDLQAIEPGDLIVMACPKCKDIHVTTADRSYKGKPGEKLTLVHLCPTCETKIVITGEGKLAKENLVHTCKMCGSSDVVGGVMKKGTPSDAPGTMDHSHM
jgi:hypothetical protein